MNLLDDDDAWLAYAMVGNDLIGYCTSLRFEIPGRGNVAWVTQLVVDETYRHVRVATRLLYGTWQFSDLYAWGLVTANPLAVRALETATRRPCRRATIAAQGPEVLEHLSARVGYLPSTFVVDNRNRFQPKVDTEFYLDLSPMPELREKAARNERPWSLGDIESGEEWFACTFASQSPATIDSTRLEELLTGSDETWIHAYERMTLTAEHRWHQHAGHEVEAALALAGIEPPASVIDIGAGDGRHALELAARGYQVTAVDIAPTLVSRAEAADTSGRVTYRAQDARDELPPGDYELALCLYDVLGSSAHREDDLSVLRNTYEALRPGGVVVASVMNAALTVPFVPEAQQPTARTEFVEALERLRPTNAMETTGNIFNPQHILLYEGVHYRKEQFSEPGYRLPVELVVRDVRYQLDELAALFDAAGFELVSARPVRLGYWNEQPSLEVMDERAKELLIVARRPSE